MYGPDHIRHRECFSETQETTRDSDDLLDAVTGPSEQEEGDPTEQVEYEVNGQEGSEPTEQEEHEAREHVG